MKKKIIAFMFATILSVTSATQTYANDVLDPEWVYGIAEQVVKEQEQPICPEWLQAIAYMESRYIADVSNGSCKGLCGISTAVWGDLIEKYGGDVYDPYTNMSVACEIISQLLEKSDDPYWVMMHYNMKQTTADKNYKAGKYSRYAIDCMEKTAELEREHGK